MRKIIASINMTLDGFCDHTYGIADAELHDHYTQLINNSGVLLYGRTTYQLMENYWPSVVKNPTKDRSLNDFAVAIDSVPKIVFSHTLKSVEWKTAKVAQRDLKEEVSELRQQSGKDVLVGSPSLIAALTKLNLVDEFQLCIHPFIAGKGLVLFKNISELSALNLIKTKTFGSGVIAVSYATIRK